MGLLRATRFRVQNYQNIDDSGWIPLERVTAFVGRNESGKTALLRALHKFNPATTNPYNPQREFPRDRFTREFKKPDDWPACSVEFEIDASLREQLSEITEGEDPPAKVEITKRYDGTRWFGFEPKPTEVVLQPAEVETALSTFSSGAMKLQSPVPEQEQHYQGIRSDLLNWVDACKDRLQRFDDLKTADGTLLLQTFRNEANSKARGEIAQILETLRTELERLIKKAGMPSVAQQLWDSIERYLPIFIYFDDYGVLDSAVYLPRLLEDLQRTPNDSRVRTVNAMFKHVGLSAQEIYDLGRSQAEEARARGQQVTPQMIAKDQEKKELRSIKLNSASIDITKRFSAWWKQRRHHIRYDADGDYFRIWIADDRRPDVEIELEGRSKGFQWFFSFYLVFLVESEEGHRDAVLLLDEPGLDLHATAQQELIAFFEKLSEHNQLIYTTHSPFLIDGEHLHRVRPVSEDATGHSSISIGEWPKDRETIFPLQAAAGYAMVRALFQHRKNVLVEGISEYFLLHALSILCRNQGLTGLPNDIYITPCGGTKLVGHFASLFLGQNVRPLVLLDADDAGRVRQSALLKELYTGNEQAILMLDEVFEADDFEIEDLIGEKHYLPFLSEFLGRKLTLAKEDRANGALPEHIKAGAARQGIELPEGWKAEVARRIATTWSTAQPAEIPSDVLEKAARLYGAIVHRFEQMG